MDISKTSDSKTPSTLAKRWLAVASVDSSATSRRFRRLCRRNRRL